MITDPGFGGNFSLPDICYKHNTSECKQLRRVLKGIEDNFLILAGPTRGDLQLGLLFTNREELGDVVINGLVIKAWAVGTKEFVILWGLRKESSRLQPLALGEQTSLFR